MLSEAFAEAIADRAACRVGKRFAVKCAFVVITGTLRD